MLDNNNKLNWFPGHMASSMRGLENYIKQSDAIVYVLDARCPKSCLNPEFEKFTARRPVIFVHNKIDLAPGKGLRTDIIAELNKKCGAKVGFIRAMVIGVPNVGKSTIINRLAKRKKTMTGDKPGVTRVPQWVPVAPKIYLLDTPGILWPNLENQKVARNLAYIGSIKDDVMDIIQLANRLSSDLNLGKTATDEQEARTLLHDFRAGKFGKFNLDRLLN